jgi:hypothetical protein
MDKLADDLDIMTMIRMEEIVDSNALVLAMFDPIEDVYIVSTCTRSSS